MKPFLSLALVFALMSCSGSGRNGCSGPFAPGPAPEAPASISAVTSPYLIAGDSIAAGLADSGYMSTHYARPWKNAGVPGQTSTGLRARWPSLLRGATKIVVSIGTNDCRYTATGSGQLQVPIAQIEANILAMWTGAQAARVKIIQDNLGPDPDADNASQECIAEVNAWEAQTVQNFRDVVLIDFHLLVQDHANPSVFQSALTDDNIHPSQKGYQMLAQKIWQEDPWR